MNLLDAFSRLRSLFIVETPEGGAAVPYLPPQPDEPLAVIGDIHGHDDLLKALLERIARESPAARIVCVGDVIDRGPSSAEALRRLRDMGDDVIVLRGNHEQMMLDFLDATGDHGARWLRSGGTATLGSFGIQALSGAEDEHVLLQARVALQDALSDGLGGWLRNLPLFWRSGNVAVVHAGADPRVPIEQQAPAHLMWGHPGFGRRARSDRVWVVHGHTIVATPRTGVGTVSVDTGAYASGCLSAALIEAGEIRFLTT